MISKTHHFVATLACALLAGCSDGAGDPPVVSGPLYSIGSNIENPEGRTLYVQTLSALDVPKVDNARALEFAGSAQHWAYGGDVYIGLDDEPVIAKYAPDETGALQEIARVSLAKLGIAKVPWGHVFVSPQKAYIFADTAYKVVVWNPEAMTIDGTIDLAPKLKREGFEVEVYEPISYEGRTYVTVRHAQWNTLTIDPKTAMLVIDEATDSVVAYVEDTRCPASTGSALGPDGKLYVVGDGRNYMLQVVALMRKATPPPTCMLRFDPEKAEFEPDFRVEIPEATGAREAVTTAWSWEPGGRYAFLRLYHPEQVTSDMTIAGYDFWTYPIFKIWRVTLGDAPVFEPLEGVPFSVVDLGPGHAPVVCEAQSYEQGCQAFSVDAEQNRATPIFRMDGLLRGLYPLR